MEASCAPRSDAERLRSWSAARRGALVGVGFPGGIKVGLWAGLCLGFPSDPAKPEETLVEARSDTDVQIVRQTRV
ncbi:hypothetical protein R1sor_007384 [Riccia sorocarpa]|uniref:Uncharacterized protein n=1 Tax=Riccia sorocarpa TaxID=122646 RepID=A0ABD3HQQ1_9MARC